jgi:hypothetical protein
VQRAPPVKSVVDGQTRQQLTVALCDDELSIVAAVDLVLDGRKLTCGFEVGIRYGCRRCATRPCLNLNVREILNGDGRGLE